MPEETEPTISEELLRASELKYRRLFETAKDGILILDAKTGAITDVNPFLLNLLGFAYDEFIGARLWDIGPFKDVMECKLAFVELQEKEYIRYESLPLETRDGKSVAVEFVSNVYGLSGGTRVIQCNIRDITKRKQVDDALHRSEEEYRLFFHSNLAGNYVSTPDGKVLACNSAFAGMFGFTSIEEALKQNLASLYPDPRDLEVFVDAVRNHRRLEHHERELRRPDGRAVHVIESAIGKFDKQGELIEILGYLTDETEHRKTEQQLRQALKMEAVGQLAGGIAHDFNNILGVITGYSEILLGDPEIADVTQRRVREILKAGKLATDLTGQLLAFSRKQVLQPKMLNLNLVLRGIDQTLLHLIGEDIEVRTELDPNLEAVKADPTQMEQVLLNLCINARDAMPEGGKITIETANVEVDELLSGQHLPMKPGHYVRLAVSDTGTGMDKETLSHVFEPFFTTKGPEKGTGLGLATVYGIVKQSGGYVWAYSEPRQGATFSVYLPASTEEAELSKQEAKPQEIMRGSETILLVEDVAPLRDVTRELLEGRGYTVLEAADGKLAIEIADQYDGNIALLLADVMLPKIGGPALAQSLLRRRSGMKVLYMSGYANGAIVDSGVLKPGTAFLQKPFTAKELAKKVRELLDTPG
jgi:two-component system, cell cycle sensor histidine kinase and response regulator CckA